MQGAGLQVFLSWIGDHGPGIDDFFGCSYRLFWRRVIFFIFFVKIGVIDVMP